VETTAVETATTKATAVETAASKTSSMETTAATEASTTSAVPGGPCCGPEHYEGEAN